MWVVVNQPHRVHIHLLLQKQDVVQISPNGQLSGVVINGLWSAQSISIDKGKGRLIVGLTNSDSIRVFDLNI